MVGARLACAVAIACAISCGAPSRAPVDGDVIEEPDAPAQPGEFDSACTKHTDCRSGYCVEALGASGGVCSRTCNDDCPAGWECRSVKLPEADVKVCVPSAPQLCLACASDTECGGGACLPLDGGGFCGTPCTSTCPTGYTCAPDASGGHSGNFCQPVTGSCSCNAAMDGAMRSCSVSSSSGTCLGTQTCSATTGWSTCSAGTPGPEVCDGADNDCNFIIDDGVGGGDACVNTVPNVGSCPGVRQCNGASGFACVGPIPAMETCNFADDDCDSSVDEGFPGLGQACTAGIGACTRYGSQRCNALGTGLECSAVAGAPVAELCNQVDDDCDSNTDETFTTLGMQCSAGLGVCARYGTYVCSANGMGTQCSAVAGTNATAEACNYLDDDCDGVLDNGFKNAVTGFYDTDANCGACGNNCTTLYTAQNSFGACQVSGTPQCVMRCDAGYGNLNGSTLDGCEFFLDAAAIYVSTTDASAADDGTCGLGPTGTAPGNHPCKTIGFGLTRSTMTGRTKVLVADGTYNEGVTLVNGKNLMGGYRADTWERHVATTSTVIAGVLTSGAHDRTVVAASITSATVFEGFVVRGSFNAKSGGNSYAVYISNSNANLVVRDNQIFAGRGGPGGAGMPGTKGIAGANGLGAGPPPDAAYDAKTATGSGFCATTNNRQYSNGGVRTCGVDVVSGGNGGGNRCEPSSTLTEFSGIDGIGGQPSNGPGGGAGVGGDAGDDGRLEQSSSRCVVGNGTITIITFGQDGTAGSNGSNAVGVAGCANPSGSVAGGEWQGGVGAAGLLGANGGGGGGGGAGGGGYCYSCTNNKDVLGGHGGGGGSGGCGGTGGGGGGAGGGVFGIFVTGGTAPTITNNAIQRGDGGNGGQGGIGGAGGLGGAGGAGGNSALFCADKAGRGGDGGAAGHGSGGGGGCGGSSFGIFTSGVGTPSYCGANTISGGAAGSGGAGGFSGGASGGAGAAGVLQTCVSL